MPTSVKRAYRRA
jgi:hypothetical protein